MQVIDLERLRCFHSCDISSVSNGEMVADAGFSDETWLDDFRWLEEQIGFYPLFFAYGNYYAIGNTFYAGHHTAPPSEINRVLNILALDSLERVVFTDYDVWVRGWPGEFPEPSAEFANALFKPSWSREQWIELAGKFPYRVQLLAPSLDFRKASQIWVRSRESQRSLKRLGLKNVAVRRVDNPVGWDESLADLPS